MDNPFINNGFINSNVSINKLTIGTVPDFIQDKTIIGKTALDIFSTALFIEEIKKHSNDLKLDLNKIEEKMLPQYLNDLYDSEDEKIRETSENIVKKFGENLGLILLTLKKGEKENRIKRCSWNSSNWDYWNQIENVILVGGLASSKTGEKLKHYAESIFYKDNVAPYNIILDKDSANAGIRGCSTYIKNTSENGKYLIFDFGQTFIKRSVVFFENSKLIDIELLSKIKSKYVEWNFDSLEDEKKAAENLNEHVIDVITKTIKDCIKSDADKNISDENIGDTIVISIANYVENGKFANRGGYGKLRLICSNYEEYLSDKIFEKTNRKFSFKLVHDGTAMAAGFLNYKNAVCISLGTAFGVGFPIYKY